MRQLELLLRELLLLHAGCMALVCYIHFEYSRAAVARTASAACSMHYGTVHHGYFDMTPLTCCHENTSLLLVCVCVSTYCIGDATKTHASYLTRLSTTYCIKRKHRRCGRRMDWVLQVLQVLETCGCHSEALALETLRV